MDWQGRDVAAVKYKGFTTVGAGLREALSKNNISLVGDTKNLKSGDTAIYVFGETPYAEFEGDKDSTDFDKINLRILRF